MSPVKWQLLLSHVLMPRSKSKLGQLVLRLLLFLTTMCLAQSLQAAVGFTVTPGSVSNTFNGTIALQVTGLSSGAPVVVQKFFDVNTNGVIDAPDILWQQFRLTDGQAAVIGGVTNINVPGDNDPVAGQITSRINFRSDDFSQMFVGKYLYKISSPTGAFARSRTVSPSPIFHMASESPAALSTLAQMSPMQVSSFFLHPAQDTVLATPSSPA